MMVPILEKKKLRLGRVKQLAQGHTEEQDRVSVKTPELVFLATVS